MIKPRYYQSAAHDAVISWWKHTTDPCVVEASTGSGKSVMVAMLAKTLYDLSGGKRVLCLAPSRELVLQNAEKYGLLGEQYSIYSASISKSLRHQVIFATEQTFKKVAKRIGNEFAGVIVDECHRITDTIKNIISDMREGNSNLRVCGLSGTPFRLGDGFVFAIDVNGNAIHETQTRNPYFKKLVYYIGAKELIEKGYLTPVVVGDINAESYDVSGLEIQKNGTFKQETVDRAFEGWGRKTANIVADVVKQSQGRKGVMIFAATVRHAEEIMASLPPQISAIVTGKTTNAERASIISKFKKQEIKYLVNVSVLTTGFDATHCDVIAILRATESISLFQQIIGRGLRIHEGKKDCLVLCYAGNIDRHCPDGDVFRPEIRASYQSKSEGEISCKCPQCGSLNLFTARKNDMGAEINEYGYFVDLDGNEIIVDGTNKPFPAHHGRRCAQFVYRNKTYEQCDYFWSSKECPACNHLNDIAARYCRQCTEELIDPAAKLVVLHKKHKKDPTQPQSDEVLEMTVIPTISRSGNEMIRVEFLTPTRMFTVYYQTNAKSQWLHDQYSFFMNMTDGGIQKPRTVQYRKENDFYRVLGFNKPTDDEVLQNEVSRMDNGTRRSELPQQELPHGNIGASDVREQAAETVP